MLGITLGVADYVERLQGELSRVDCAQVENWAALVYRAWELEKCVFVFGNGGSGTTASHISEDVGKSTLRDEDLQDETKKRLKIMSLTDNVGWILAVANDLSYDQIFVQQLMNFAVPGDLAIGISGSGNSPNVLHAIDWANRHGLTTLGLTGYDGGALMQQAQHNVHVPLADMGMVESIHLCMHHWMLNDVHARINKLGRHAENP
jgi:D-sedoheptulose 7-phosphate isomerase